MELPKKYDPQEMEDRWRKHWKQEQLYAYDPSRPREETFVVDTPPPTVSGSLHVGHLFSYSHQDFVVRFQRMCGKNIFFPIGWDDNGLPTERRVQNLYNVKCEPHIHHESNLRFERGRKGDPTPISRPNFIELCNEVTKDDEEAFRRLWTRLGLSYDWDQEYATIDEHCRRTSQFSFLELLEKGECYQAERPVMWDVDFRTAIAQAELTDKEIPSAFHYLRFGIQGGDRDHIVIATTRPELLPACVAVLAHPEDARYQPLFGKQAVTPLFHVPVPIMPDPHADPAKGTGIVMVCTFGDQTDVDWWREFDLPLRQIVGYDGHLMPVSFGEPGWESLDADAANNVYRRMQGHYVKKAQRIIVEIAESTPGVIDRPSEPITHAVKFFEKGDRPLELIPARQWFTRILDKKDALIEQGHKIQWYPEFMGKRYEHWVEGLNQDWCMSRQRYFGVPIPVWYRIDDAGRVVYEERLLPRLEQLPIDPLDDVPDGFSEEQRDQPGGFTGDPDVLDTWATSSLSPQIASRWVEDRARHKNLFPMDVRPQSHEIIRTWAFYTICKAYMHEREVPWHNVVISGWILDPDRKKMSKSQGNVVTPEPLLDEFGADSVRYWAARARLGVDTAYDEQVFKVGKRLCTKLFNASKFAVGCFGDIDPALLGADKITAETDRAVFDQLRPVIERATGAFEQFDYAQALSLTEDFFWQTFCDNYLELSKSRTYDEELTPGRISAASTLRLLHRALVRMLAPFLPYIAEDIWHWCYSGDADMQESVHRSPWPTLAEFAAIPAALREDMYPAAVQVIEAVRKAKADANKSMRAPVARVAVTAKATTLDALKLALDDVVGMLHIERIDLVEGAPESGLVAVEIEMAE
ncbi:MAG TPA: valine--tRNA ligase [Candidatus Hydrogenedentes bacterium]|nr:valine--tRNA ligase [Candidatus Hydrogenedentota bacterium]HPG69317.1 valine--tRNA ligase [Candidatus Hydrogenedentota bacterium]